MTAVRIAIATGTVGTHRVVVDTGVEATAVAAGSADAVARGQDVGTGIAEVATGGARMAAAATEVEALGRRGSEDGARRHPVPVRQTRGARPAERTRLFISRGRRAS